VELEAGVRAGDDQFGLAPCGAGATLTKHKHLEGHKTRAAEMLGRFAKGQLDALVVGIRRSEDGSRMS
jgi:hypothetical protein